MSGPTQIFNPALQQFQNNFRLSLVSATPITTTDATYAAAQSIFAVPYNGNNISLHDGTNWNTYNAPQFSTALGTLTSAVGYDAFCYASSGTPTLEYTAWTNASTRATNLVYQNGVLVKSGDTTRRYLGSFYNPGAKNSTVTITNASPCVVTWSSGNHNLPVNAPIVFTTTGGLPAGLTAGTTYYLASLSATATATTFNVSLTPGGALINTSSAGSGVHTGTVPTYTEDSVANRFLFNYYNFVPRQLYRTDPTTSHTYSTNTNRQSNANVFNQVNFFTGISEQMMGVAYKCQAGNTTAGVSFLSGIGVNSTTVIPNTEEATAQVFQPAAVATVPSVVGVSFYNYTPAIGLNYIAMIEFSSANLTTTWFDSKGAMVGVVSQ